MSKQASNVVPFVCRRDIRTAIIKDRVEEINATLAFDIRDDLLLLCDRLALQPEQQEVVKVMMIGINTIIATMDFEEDTST